MKLISFIFHQFGGEKHLSLDTRGSPRVAVVPPSEMAIAGKPDASSHKRPMEPSQVGRCI